MARALLLLSGGIDSPVAGHLARRAGYEVHAVHFSLEPHTDDAAEQKARALARRLDLRRFHVVRVGDAFAELVRSCTHRYYFVLSKRLMLRVAERIALQEGCEVLITGESLGQVSSQTLPNLAVIDAAATLPVLRPLIGFDKEEIVAWARALGTYEISKGPEVCDALGPPKPATAAQPEAIEAEERKVDVGALVDRTVSAARAESVEPSNRYVLDASALLSGRQFEGDLLTTPEALAEVRRHGSTPSLDAFLATKVNVVSPDDASLRAVRSEAMKTGDVARLSRTDTGLLAVAREREATLLTDDYSIQNVAAAMRIQYAPVLEEGITEQVRWYYRCASCGKYTEGPARECAVCGGIVRTTRRAPKLGKVS